MQALSRGTVGDKLDPVNSMVGWVVCNESKNELMWTSMGKIKSLRQMVWNGKIMDVLNLAGWKTCVEWDDLDGMGWDGMK